MTKPGNFEKCHLKQLILKHATLKIIYSLYYFLVMNLIEIVVYFFLQMRNTKRKNGREKYGEFQNKAKLDVI